jgi:nucleoid-associated protein YgaU
MVFSVLGLPVALLLVRLIQGHESEIAVRGRSFGDASVLPTSESNQLSAAEHSLPANPALAPNAAASHPLSRPTPVPSNQGAQAVAPESANAAAGQSEIVYTVKSGDTLRQIARLYGTTVRAIEAANGLRTDHLTVGAKLRLPNAKLLAVSASQPGNPQ